VEAAPARALLSWANAPYIAAAGFGGYRCYKAFLGVKADQRSAIDAYGKKLVLGPKQSRAQFDALTKVYRKKLCYVPRDGELFASGLAAIAAKPSSVASLAAFEDLLAVFGHSGAQAGAALGAVFASTVTRTSERGKVLFYASRVGVASDALRADAAEGLDNSLEFLAASQAGLADQAYASAIKGKGRERPFSANAAAAAALGLDAAAAARVLEDVNRVPGEDDDKAEWLKDLEAKVADESGPLPTADEVDTEDKFAPKGEDDEMMLTCECGECGYTLFIAAGREGKFFGDSYKCPSCGAPKSKFKIDDANAGGAK